MLGTVKVSDKSSAEMFKELLNAKTEYLTVLAGITKYPQMESLIKNND